MHPASTRKPNRPAREPTRPNPGGWISCGWSSKLAGEFQEQHFPTLAASTRRDYTHLLGEFVEAFGDRDAAKIKRGEIIRYLDQVKARSGSQANRATTIIRQLFGFARDRYDLDANPAADIKAPAKPKTRKRTLDRQEIRVLWRACELAGYPYGHVLRMALCTGQRIGEIGMMRWDEIEGRYWRNTENKTGQRIDIYPGRPRRANRQALPAHQRITSSPTARTAFDPIHGEAGPVAHLPGISRR